jgi:hypothetical protein
MITTTEYSQPCDQRVQLARRWSTGTNEAMSFGSSFHLACATGEIDPGNQDPELEGIFYRWLDQHDPLYGSGKKFPETGFNLKISLKGEEISLKLVKKPTGFTISSTCDEIIVGEEDIFIYERKTTSRDVSTVAEKYLAGSQLKIYNLLGHALKGMTGKNVILFLDVIKKKVPGTLHLNKCTKKHNPEIICESCLNTGHVKISSQACETTSEEYDRVFAEFPHLRTPEAEEARERAKMNNFGQIYPMPLQPINPEFIRSLKEKNKSVNSKTPHKAFSECPECVFSSYCHHGVEPDAPQTKPAPLNDILQVLKAVKK